MKLWDNPVKRSSLATCICGKDKSQMNVMLGLVHRQVALFVVGLIALLLSFALIGIGETVARFWWAVALTVWLVFRLARASLQQHSRGHTPYCALRYAIYKLF